MGLGKERYISLVKYYAILKNNNEYLLLLFRHKSCVTLCDLMDCSMPGSSVLQYLPEFAQTHAH